MCLMKRAFIEVTNMLNLKSVVVEKNNSPVQQFFRARFGRYVKSASRKAVDSVYNPGAGRVNYKKT